MVGSETINDIQIIPESLLVLLRSQSRFHQAFSATYSF